MDLLIQVFITTPLSLIQLGYRLGCMSDEEIENSDIGSLQVGLPPKRSMQYLSIRYRKGKVSFVDSLIRSLKFVRMIST